jgi:AcrR family transcriptional regulator
MASVTTRDAEATRRAILDAAEEMIAQGGEEGFSIRELCARAGVTAPTVYHHFGDKDAIVRRVVDDCFAHFDRVHTAGPRPADPVAALRAGFDRFIDYGVAHPRHYVLLFGRRRAEPSPVGDASYERLVQACAAVAAAGRLTVPVEDAAAATFAAMHGVTSLIVAGYLRADAPAVALVRGALLARLTVADPARSRASREGAAPLTRDKKNKKRSRT